MVSTFLNENNEMLNKHIKLNLKSFLNCAHTAYDEDANEDIDVAETSENHCNDNVLMDTCQLMTEMSRFIEDHIDTIDCVIYIFVSLKNVIF